LTRSTSDPSVRFFKGSEPSLGAAAGSPAGVTADLPPLDSSEASLILLCLRGRWQPAAVEAAGDAMGRPGFDWRRWYEMVCAEGLAPLVYHTLHGKNIIPARVDTELRMGYLRNSLRNDLRVRELHQVLGFLTGAGIPAILLKGSALALAVYRNIALRPMEDVDLLVHPEHVQRAQEALQRSGYRASISEMDGPAALAYGNEVQMHRAGSSGSVIEVHWGLLNSTHYGRIVPVEWFWSSAEPLSFRGADTLILGPEAQVVHLCGHLALHHAGKGMLWLHDVAEVIYHYGDRLDWQTVIERAQAFDLVLPLQQTLPRVAEGWDAPIPAGVLARLAELKPSPEETRVVRWMTAPERTVEVEVWSNLSSLPGWAERGRYLAAKVFPAPEYMRQRYSVRHAALLPLAYPRRWWIGVRRALAGVRRAMRSHAGGRMTANEED
jgi:hypothetical protein